MHRIYSGNISRWLMPAVLILFILEVLTMPLVLGITYAGRSESPEHVLSYTQGRLRWDKDTVVNDEGVAELNLFDAVYPAVEAVDGVNVVAPGTEGYSFVRLHNEVNGPVNYIAVLYRIRTSDALPVEAQLIGSGFTDTEEYFLPDGIDQSQVLRAVSGTVKGKEIQDFDIAWLWNYEVSAQQDQADTKLGDKSSADEVVLGLYIVVEDNNVYTVPKTGDESHIAMYFALMAISLLVLILLLRDLRKEKKCA